MRYRVYISPPAAAAFNKLYRVHERQALVHVRAIGDRCNFHDIMLRVTDDLPVMPEESGSD